MTSLSEEMEFSSDRQSAYLGLAAVLHAMLFIWNPVMFQGVWKAITVPKSEIVILDVTGLEAAISTRRAAVPARPVSFRGSAMGRVRPVHFIRTPVLPSTINQDLSGYRTAAPIALDKEGTVSVPAARGPVLISRERTVPAGASFTSREIPIQGVSAGVERSIPETVRAAAPSSAKGMAIEGPLASRAVTHRVIPDYPAWAEEQGIGGIVRLYFRVAPNGRVQSTMRVDRTSGNTALDTLAMEALRQWRFSETASEEVQWGIITFTFSLSRME